MKLDKIRTPSPLVFCFLFLFLLNAAQIVASYEAQARDLVIAYESDPDTLDLLSVRHGPTAIPVAINVMDYLCETMPDGELIPGLATEWKLSPDKLSLEFTLRKGVKFHSGDPLTTEDVLFSYNRIKEKTRAPEFRWVKGIEAIDDYTFKVLFTRPDVLFLKSRGFPIGSKKYYERVGEDRFIKEVVGTGPYKVKDWKAGSYLDLERFDDYWGKKPEIQKVRFRFVSEGTTRVSMLQAGEADMITSTPYPMVGTLEQAGYKTVKLPAHPTTQVQFQALNPNVPWYDKRVRLAIAHAIDGDAIVKNLFNDIPARVWLSPWEVGYDPDLKLYEYNPEKSKKLLAEAGYAKGFEMPLYYWAGRTTGQKETTEAVALYLNAIGIKCNLIGWEPVKMIEAIRNKWHGKKDAVYVGVATPPIAHQVDPVNGLRTSYWSESTISLYDNPEFDKVFLQAIQEFDDAKRAGLIKKALRIVREDVATVPIWANVSVYAMKKDIEFTPTFRVMNAEVKVRDIHVSE
jgi:peptide/nickel transport system substrate-binding protein